MLAENGITDLVALSHKLSSTIPNIISIELNPSASRNVLNASSPTCATPWRAPRRRRSRNSTSGCGARRARCRRRARPARQGGARGAGRRRPAAPATAPAPAAAPAEDTFGRTPFKCATAHSSEEKTDAAVAAAVRQLGRPPGRRRAHPRHRLLRRRARRGGGGGGARGEAAGDDEGARGVIAIERLVVDGSGKRVDMMALMSPAPRRPFLALQGFVDPDGAYALVHVEHGAEVPIFGMDVNRAGDAVGRLCLRAGQTHQDGGGRDGGGGAPRLRRGRGRGAGQEADGQLRAHRAALRLRLWESRVPRLGDQGAHERGGRRAPRRRRGRGATGDAGRGHQQGARRRAKGLRDREERDGLRAVLAHCARRRRLLQWTDSGGGRLMPRRCDEDGGAPRDQRDRRRACVRRLPPLARRRRLLGRDDRGLLLKKARLGDDALRG